MDRAAELKEQLARALAADAAKPSPVIAALNTLHKCLSLNLTEGQATAVNKAFENLRTEIKRSCVGYTADREGRVVPLRVEVSRG